MVSAHFCSLYEREMCSDPNGAYLTPVMPNDTRMATELHGKIPNIGFSFRVFRVIPRLFIGPGS